MKIADIVIQLAKILPIISDRYTSSVDVSTISGNGTAATVTTSSSHSLVVGSPVIITNVAIDTGITTVSLLGNIATIETATNHDLTLGWPPHKTVTLSGFTDTAWNDSFTLTKVQNRRKFSIDATSLIAPVLTGSEILKELVTGGFNGPQQVLTVPDNTTFTFSSSFSTDASGGQVVTELRIAGAVSGARAEAEYTKQKNDKDVWIFVTQPDNVSISKDRRALGDAISEQGATTSFQLDILDGFTVWAFIHAKNSKAGLGPSDLARDSILRDLLLSVQRFKPASGLADETPSRVVLSSHGQAVYNGSYYAHQFIFQIPLRMSIKDTIDIVETVAFRDVDLTIENNESASVLTALVDLDEEPLP